MLDPRITKLAELITGHSTHLSSNDKVLIHAFDIPHEAVAEIVRVAQNRGAQVITRLESSVVKRQMMLGMSEANAKTISDTEKFEMEQMTAYIALRGGSNYAELSDVSSDKMAMWQKIYGVPVVNETRVAKTKWVVMRWPSPSMAQQANMSTSAFENFYFDVCTMDYSKMKAACDPLEELMNSTDKVRLTGPGTDLTFSIKNVLSKPCVGHRNIPDGECFSAPVRESANGEVTYNTVSLYQGTEFNNVHYKIKNGKIIEATAGENTHKINEILDTDEGARYFGEWSLGFNPFILHPMKDTLFDEKIAGSFHLTPGNAYEGAGGNGNKSAIHWDKVVIQRPEYGGGEVWFDDILIRKDGTFLLPQLEGLNPKNLGA